MNSIPNVSGLLGEDGTSPSSSLANLNPPLLLSSVDNKKLGVPRSPSPPSDAKPTDVMAKISAFFHHPETIRVLKSAAALLVIGGLVAASVFTFGAAIPAIAIAVSPASIALLGTAIGLAFSSMAAAFTAKFSNMHKATEKNWEEFGQFLAISFTWTSIITGACAGLGAIFGASVVGGALTVGFGGIGGLGITIASIQVANQNQWAGY